jgi:hypothetical protein
LSKNQKETEEMLRQTIIKSIKENKPKNTEELIALVKEKLQLPEQKITDYIVQLENEGKIILKQQLQPGPQNFGTYVKTKSAFWYWITITLTVLATLTVFMIPENAYPIIYARYLLGSIFVWILPGYGFIKALFPTKVPIPTNSNELDQVERVALSIGMSLVLVIINGFILNYTPFGIRTISATLGLFALTITFATAGIIREFQYLKKTVGLTKILRVAVID